MQFQSVSRARRALLLPVLLAAAAFFTPGCSAQAQAPTGTGSSFAPPLNDAAVGEELVLKRGQQEWRYTVVEAGDSDVRVQVMEYKNGAPVDRPKLIQWGRNTFGAPDDGVIRRIERGRVDAGGQTWDCWILHVYTRDRGRYYYWINENVAVHGIVKMAKIDDQGLDERHALTWASDSVSGR